MKKLGWENIGVGAVILALAVIFMWQLLWSGQQLTTVIAGENFSTTILRTEAEVEKGLSGTKYLDDRHAMLFVFPYEYTHGIWMKDMNYPIDILWLDRNGEVVHIVQDASPSSYRSDTDATIYKPSMNALYVIETISGTIEDTGIKVGDTVTLPSGI